jgi:hypothetical protein
MSPDHSTRLPVFSKHYTEHHRARAAAAHHTWLDQLGVPTPRLLAMRGTQIDLEYVHGRHAAPHDTLTVAALLGRIHGTAHRATLRTAVMNSAVPLGNGQSIEGFAAVRTAAIRSRLAAGVPDPRLDLDEAEALLNGTEGQPPAIYKDTNVRNVLITTAGPVLIDFDDLTLAPFGYDLAKLLITTAMTYGHLPLGLIQRSLTAYNRTVCQQPGSPPACTLPDLIMWIEVHHILTSVYLGRHGYRHSWHTLRPW